MNFLPRNFLTYSMTFGPSWQLPLSPYMLSSSFSCCVQLWNKEQLRTQAATSKGSPVPSFGFFFFSLQDCHLAMCLSHFGSRQSEHCSVPSSPFSLLLSPLTSRLTNAFSIYLCWMTLMVPSGPKMIIQQASGKYRGTSKR
jgi:hypothetical protein